MLKSRKIDMTTGPILRNVFLFAIPIVIGNVLQQLYTTVDTLIVGHYCGKTSLAAIGTSAQPVEVLLCIFLGIGSGVSILVSQYVGSKDMVKLRALTKTSISFVYIVGILMGVLGYILAPWMLKAMGVPSDSYNEALIYTRIVFLGAVGNIGYNMNAGILRGLGDSKSSLWFLIISCVLNIILDFYFVAFLGKGIGGAALSTTIGMIISWLFSIGYIIKKHQELHFSYLPRGISQLEMRNMLSYGLPLGLNNSLFSFGHVAMQTMVNAQGSSFMAGASVAGRITGIATVAITALSSAATTFAGQNYGAGNIERLKAGHLRIPLISGAITLSCGLFFLSIHRPLLGFFSNDPEVLMYASRYVTVMLLCQWCYAVFNGISCILNGVGFIKYTTIINLLMLWAVRIPSAYIIMKCFSGKFIMLCFPISFSFGMFCMLGYYAFSKKWKQIFIG